MPGSTQGFDCLVVYIYTCMYVNCGAADFTYIYQKTVTTVGGKGLRRTKEEAEATRLAILASALDLFFQRGVAETSLGDIAAAAGVTRGAIYWHFKNKWDLFDSLCDQYCHGMEMIKAQPREDIEDPLGLLGKMLEEYFLDIAQSEPARQIFLICLRESSSPFEERELPARVREVSNLIHERKISILRSARQKGQLPEDIDLEAGAILIKAMVEGIVVNWLKTPQRFSLAERGRQFAESIIATLRYGAKIDR